MTGDDDVPANLEDYSDAQTLSLWTNSMVDTWLANHYLAILQQIRNCGDDHHLPSALVVLADSADPSFSDQTSNIFSVRSDWTIVSPQAAASLKITERKPTALISKAGSEHIPKMTKSLPSQSNPVLEISQVLAIIRRRHAWSRHAHVSSTLSASGGF